MHQQGLYDSVDMQGLQKRTCHIIIPPLTVAISLGQGPLELSKKETEG
jgi:hypothetical protein